MCIVLVNGTMRHHLEHLLLLLIPDIPLVFYSEEQGFCSIPFLAIIFLGIWVLVMALFRSIHANGSFLLPFRCQMMSLSQAWQWHRSYKLESQQYFQMNVDSSTSTAPLLEMSPILTRKNIKELLTATNNIT